MAFEHREEAMGQSRASSATQNKPKAYFKAVPPKSLVSCVTE